MRDLGQNERLLYKQKIEGNKKISKSTLATLPVQKPNRKLLIFPFSFHYWLYRNGLNSYDTTKLENKRNNIVAKYDERIKSTTGSKKAERLSSKKGRKVGKVEKVLNEGNLFMRAGEPLSVYDSSFSEQSVQKIRRFLHSRSYFNAEVNYALSSKGRRVYQTFSIDQGPSFILDSLYYEIDDPKVLNLVQSSPSLLKKKAAYSQNRLNTERNRIDDLLRNNGYFDFTKQFITFEVDSTGGNHKVSIGTLVSNPEENKHHKIYTIDSVIFTTDANLQLKNFNSDRINEVYNHVTYRYYVKRYSKKVVDRRLFIYPDNIYSKQKTFDTQTQLGFMDIFKFVNVNYDTTGGRFIANVYTNPLDRYQFAIETGLNVSVGLPGPFINTSLKIRNIFHGLEILQFNIRWGLEGVASATNVTDVYSSQEFSTNLSLTFPQFIAPLRKNSKLRVNPLNPRTVVQGGFTFLDRPEYTRNNVNTSFSYLWQNKTNAYYNFTLAEVSVINTVDIANDFQGLLDDLREQGNNLWRSFEPSFVSSMLFSATFNYNKYGYYENKASYLRLATDLGGTFLNLGGKDFFQERNLETYQYFKLNLDFRHHKPLPYSTQIAYKINAGFANPYGENSTLPYEKFFFIGGSNSIRAWRPRRLGPGTFFRTDSITGRADDSFEQPGEIIFETSFEVRKKVLGFLETAFFVDAGNIWTLKEDEQRPGAHFQIDSFLSEIAIGSGLGLRLNFDFLIVRLDAGIKVYDPARDKQKRFIFQRGFNDFPFDQVDPVILNLGVGYPF